jgi:hypothetical protein
MMLVFGVGIWVGERRAEFSFAWAENYHRNFGGPSTGMFGNFPEQDFISGHGVFGRVLAVDGASFIMQGQDTAETTVVVGPQTMIVSSRGATNYASILSGSTVVVIGDPDSQGRVQAKFIRILPSALPVLFVYPQHYIHVTILNI